MSCWEGNREGQARMLEVVGRLHQRPELHVQHVPFLHNDGCGCLAAHVAQLRPGYYAFEDDLVKAFECSEEDALWMYESTRTLPELEFFAIHGRRP